MINWPNACFASFSAVLRRNEKLVLYNAFTGPLSLTLFYCPVDVDYGCECERRVFICVCGRIILNCYSPLRRTPHSPKLAFFGFPSLHDSQDSPNRLVSGPTFTLLSSFIADGQNFS